MRHSKAVVVLALLLVPMSGLAGEGYKITGNAGVMYFVAIEAAQRDSEDVYRYAVAAACAGKRVCQVQFWIDSAPKSFPLTDAQFEAKLVHWQQNLNTGLRRWLVKCDSSELFSRERECM